MLLFIKSSKAKTTQNLESTVLVDYKLNVQLVLPSFYTRKIVKISRCTCTKFPPFLAFICHVIVTVFLGYVYIAHLNIHMRNSVTMFHDLVLVINYVLLKLCE